MNKSSFNLDFPVAAIAFAALFVVLLGVLHVVRSDLDPSWHFISEYGIGRFGWMMQFAFIALATSNLFLLVAVWPVVRGAWGRIGLALFLIGTLGTVLAGFFVCDPITTTPSMATSSGWMHNLGGTLGLAGIPGTFTISWKLLRCDAWRSARSAVIVATAIFAIGFLVSFVTIAVLVARHGGVFGPDVPVGWPNRVGILAGCVWLMVVGWQAKRSEGTPIAPS